MTTGEEWAARFSEQRPRYAEFQRRIEALMVDLIRDGGIDYVQIESRTKEVESLREKLQRKKFDDDDIDVLSGIHDLVGVRVITYYHEDISRVTELITEQFEVDVENSMDKSDALLSDQFGYLSTHFVVRLKPDRQSLREWQSYEGLVAEIQVRTALQHAWAAVSHKLDYKTAKDAPDAVRRSLYRLSALFELADEQFSTIRERVQALDSEYRTSVNEGDLELPLDSSSLIAYLNVAPHARAAAGLWDADGFTDVTVDSDRVSRDRSDLLDCLKSFGMTTLADLDDFLKRKPDIRKASKALAQDEGRFLEATLEDWLTQVVIVWMDQSDKPGDKYYNEGAVKKLLRVREAVA